MPATKPRKTTKPAKSTSTVDSLASISAEQFDSQAEKLAGQERTAKLQLASKKVEGVLIKGQEQDVKNTALLDRVTHAESVRGVQAQTMAQKLSQEQNALTFATAETALKQENLNIQKEGLEAHNTFGRDMLRPLRICTAPGCKLPRPMYKTLLPVPKMKRPSSQAT